jgi:hypothetical protein
VPARKWYPIAFSVGDGPNDYVTKDTLDRWLISINSWVSATQVNETDPRSKAERVVKAALSGSKLNGEMWPGVEKYSLERRIQQLCGWDVVNNRGREGNLSRLRGKGAGEPARKKADATKVANDQIIRDMTLDEMYRKRENFISVLHEQFPHLNNPVYAAKVQALAEAEVRLMSLSDTFMSSTGKTMKLALEIQEGLRKSINELMTLLNIHPKQLVDKVDEKDRGDVGSLMNQWEDYGRVADEFERVDAIQELIQHVHRANSVRSDGSPQLADYLLFHATGCAGHMFKCQCGETYELYGGFTLEQLEAAAEQAYQKFGFGLKRIPRPPAEDDGYRTEPDTPAV